MDDTKIGCLVEDPTKDLPIGTTIEFKLIAPLDSNAVRYPQTLNNWDYFQGALLALMIKTADDVHIFGTAFMISPGLAITATHVVYDFKEIIESGKVAFYCMGIRSECTELWKVTSLIFNEIDDICFLLVSTVSNVSENHKFYRFGLTTRTPKNGETIQIFGFREHQSKMSTSSFQFTVDIFASSGIVTAVYPYGRGKTYMPYPVIELDCGSLCGMSGGIGIDKNGLVVGIISRGMDTEDQCGPTYLSWIIGALVKEVYPTWPNGLYSGITQLMNMDERLIYIDRRDALISDNCGCRYETWFE